MVNIKTEEQIKNFTCNVAWLRKTFGYSKKRMAQIMRISAWSLNKLEQGEIPSRLSVEVLIAIDEHFGVKPSTQLLKRLGTSGERE